MGLRDLFDALTKIAAQPDKDFGALVRQRRRKCGLPVAPAGKVLPLLPVRSEDTISARGVLDRTAESMLQDTLRGDALHGARLQLAERRLQGSVACPGSSVPRKFSSREFSSLERKTPRGRTHWELKTYERLHGRKDG
jgi:hypothetical protein